MMLRIFTSRTFLVLATLVLSLSFAATVFAARISGADYLARVNEQRQAAGIAPIPASSGNGALIISIIDRTTDLGNDAIQQANAGRTQWYAGPQELSRILDNATIDPETQMPDPNKNAINASKPPTGKCLSWWSDFSFEGCIWNPMMKLLGQTFLSIGGFVLWMAGGIFDALIKHVVIDFGGAIGEKGLNIMKAIGIGWTVFRDFANILIIGMFVFIAIGIILELKEFGQKKLIANVLIIAVLMNFSLLFTQLIIDFSNYLAFTIYSNMSTTALDAKGGFDIAQAFLNPMGVDKVWSGSGEVIQQIINEQGSGLMGLLYGLIGGFLLIAVAAVLLYGCFLMASRAVLFIFLMLTSPIAFASYLIPAMAGSEYGFGNWWKTLINNALFAPLLMLFLAISLVIIRSAPVKSTGLEKIAANPNSLFAEDTWTVLMIYILGIALLYLSFKLSSKFASSISGFGGSGVAAIAGLAGASRVGGFVGRGVGGWTGTRIKEFAQNRAAKSGREMNAWERMAARGGRKLETSSFDVLSTKPFAGVAKTFGGEKIGVGGRAAAVKRRADAAVHLAGDIALKGEALEKAKKVALTNVTAEHQPEMAAATAKKKTHEEALKNAEGVREGAEKPVREATASERETIGKDIKGLEAELAKGVQELEAKKAASASEDRIEELRVAALPAGSAAASTAETSLATNRTTRQNDLNAVAAGIAATKERVDAELAKKNATLTKLNDSITAAGDQAVQAIKDEAEQGKKDADKAISDINDRIATDTEKRTAGMDEKGVAQRIATNRLGRGFGLLGGGDVAKEVKNAVRRHHQREAFQEFRKVLESQVPKAETSGDKKTSEPAGETHH